MLCTTCILQPSLCRICNSFPRYFNVKSHLKHSCRYKSWKFVLFLHFSTDGVKSAWQAGSLPVPRTITSHRLLVALYRLGKRLSLNWPWSYNTIFPYFSSSWTHIFTTNNATVSTYFMRRKWVSLIFYMYMTSQRPQRSSEQVPRTLTGWTWKGQQQNSVELIQNMNGTNMEHIQSGTRNACGTGTESILSSIPC